LHQPNVDVGIDLQKLDDGRENMQSPEYDGCR
jgi:hypothetical protein